LIASYLLAVGAAGANATSNILQRKANRREPPKLSLSPRVVVDLVHQPVWLAGMSTDVLSFLLMAAALRGGQLAAVQPIQVLELPLTLVGAAVVFRSRLGGREWAAAAMMTAGLAGLIASLAPEGGDAGRVSGVVWAVASTATTCAVLAGVGLSLRQGGARRAALLGIATGISFGVTSAYIKAATAAFAGGVTGVLTAWQTYAMVLSGVTAALLMQNALRAGRLLVTQPGVTLADPVVAILWGVLVFGEGVRGPEFVAAAVVAAAAIAAGALVLARSPLLEDEGRDAGDRSYTSPRRQ
jgi:drug/metabolite transporter (DMT)-like permease